MNKKKTEKTVLVTTNLIDVEADKAVTVLRCFKKLCEFCEDNNCIKGGSILINNRGECIIPTKAQEEEYAK